MNLLKKFIPIMFILSAIPFISLGSSDDIDIDGVIYWMYDNGLTDYSFKDQFKPEKNIRRDEAAKFVTNFSQKLLQERGEENSICYMFNDIPKNNKLREYVIQSCELGYMKGKNNKFNPGGNLSNAQAIAIVIRMYEGLLEEPKSDRSKNYYSRAKELGLLEGLDLSSKSKPISRGDFSTLLYKLGTELMNGQVREDSQNMYDQFSGLDDAISSGLNTMVETMIDMLGLKVNSHSGLNNDFINNASICYSGASNITETDFDIMGINFYVKQYRQIRGLESNQCKIYQRIEAANINISTGQIQNLIASGYATQQEIDQQMSEMQTNMQEIIGKDGICLYSTGDYVSILQSELSGVFIPLPDTSSSPNNCTGSLFEDQD